MTVKQFFGLLGPLPGMKVIVLSYKDRLLQLERLELWCRKTTTWQQYRIALPIGLFLGTAAGLLAALAPYPTPDEACQIITAQTKDESSVRSVSAAGRILQPVRQQNRIEQSQSPRVFYRVRSGGPIVYRRGDTTRAHFIEPILLRRFFGLTLSINQRTFDHGV